MTELFPIQRTPPKKKIELQTQKEVNTADGLRIIITAP
jgi:hypothetical protein